MVAEGRTQEFRAFQWQGIVPNPQELDTYARSRLDWSEPSQPAHAELFAWYRRLIQLRLQRATLSKENSLNSAKAAVNFNAEAEWLSFCHSGVLAVFNLRNEAQRVPMPSGDWELVLRSDPAELSSDVMPPLATYIYIKKLGG